MRTRIIKYLLMVMLSGCTMPLPLSVSSSSKRDLTNQLFSPLGSNTQLRSQPISLAGITIKEGLYNNRVLQYFDLNFCLDVPLCSNEFASLKTSREYHFLFADEKAIPGQDPVLSGVESNEQSPFRELFTVTAPLDYHANSIRSEEDLFASNFPIRPVNQVVNHPLVQVGVTLPESPSIEAWLGNEKVTYLDLGLIPFSPSHDRLGTASVYFLLNHDRTELPTQPLPIFDTAPGDLLYSPIRQVFRVISENQIDHSLDDPSRNIHSQDEVLAAVNKGLFRLETTPFFFNYPTHSTQAEILPLILDKFISFELSLSEIDTLPFSRNNFHYAFGWIDREGNKKLLARFRRLPTGVQDLNGQPLVIPTVNKDVFEQIDRFVITIETGENEQSESVILLSGQPNAQKDIPLHPPFQSDYNALATGSYFLATPTNGKGDSSERSGIWFAFNTGFPIVTIPNNTDLRAGLPLPDPPEGWIYNSWIQTDFRQKQWLPGGSFSQPDRSDNSHPFSGSLSGYSFPGEDFLNSPPPDVIFPFNLSSTGESSVVISLDPINISSKMPFFELYRSVINKGTPSYVNQSIASVNNRFPQVNIVISEKKE